MMNASQATSYSTHTPLPSLPTGGLSWASVGGLTVVRLEGGVRDSREWRELIAHLRPSVRPVIMWVEGRVWIGSQMRNELAAALGSSQLSMIVQDDLGRGLATALRWLGIDTTAYASSELDQLETELELPPGITERLALAF